MSYVALYRSYRPKTFDEVAGQKVIVKTLQNALLNGKIGHAYLFNGPRGTGKTTIAKIIAKALNCQKAPIANPCGECSICLGIENNDVSDIIEIDAASNNGVDEIRELRDKVKYAPSVGKYKVYIIDEVHMLTTGAFNALLKTLEEPPKYVVFILATTEIHKIPATIISRCQRFDFKNLELEDIIEKLTEVITKEKIQIDDDAIEAIAIQAEGGMRDALSLLDQMASFTDHISEEDVFLVSGGLSKRSVTQILLAAYNKDAKTILECFNSALLEGKDISKMVSDLVLSLRDCLLDKTREHKKFDKLDVLSTHHIYTYLDILNELQQDIKWTNQKRAYVEMALLKMVNHKVIETMEYDLAIMNLTKEVEALKNKLVDYQNNIAVQKPVSTKKNISSNQKPLVVVKDVEEILNNGDKTKKMTLKKAWSSLKNFDIASLKTTAALLAKGDLEAASSDKLLLVYDDIITCRIMYRKETKDKVFQILNAKQSIITDYIAILRSDWLLIKEDYSAQYNGGTSKPKLKPIDLHLYEEPVVAPPKDLTVEIAKEYFGEELVKVEE